MRLLIIFAMSGVCFFSCKKETVKEPDIASQISISNPTTGTIYINGSSLQIRGNASDDNVLSSVTCTIRNKSNNAVLYNRVLTTGNVGYFDFSQDWTITGINALTPARLLITTTDKVGYIASKEVDFELID